MTSVNVQQKDLHGMPSIEQEHIDNNTAVRNMLLSRGIIPEQLSAGEDVKKVERRLASEEKKITKKNSPSPIFHSSSTPLSTSIVRRLHRRQNTPKTFYLIFSSVFS